MKNKKVFHTLEEDSQNYLKNSGQSSKQSKHILIEDSNYILHYLFNEEEDDNNAFNLDVITPNPNKNQNKNDKQQKVSPTSINISGIYADIRFVAFVVVEGLILTNKRVLVTLTDGGTFIVKMERSTTLSLLLLLDVNNKEIFVFFLFYSFSNLSGNFLQLNQSLTTPCTYRVLQFRESLPTQNYYDTHPLIGHPGYQPKWEDIPNQILSTEYCLRTSRHIQSPEHFYLALKTHSHTPSDHNTRT